MNLRKKTAFWLLVMLPLVALMQGCATKSPDSIPVQAPRIPKLPPQLAKPAPQDSFLERARSDTRTWRETLTSSETK